ncbi:MAG: tRNA (N6-threonylcarbamoyladenosine(37)-N6)-methyltransferase TrmO [bacterium]|jgi:tRNA-Thr(GGU) m(6)t(6)A37 methyltransferase TsaA
MDIYFKPIGTIHTPFTSPRGIPIQGALRQDIKGEVEIFSEFQPGLQDVEGFSHLILIYYFDGVKGFTLQATPFLDTVPRGIFSIRGPRRPNPIGLTVVKNLGIKENIITFAGVDMVEGTPLLDIKPYFSDIDSHPDASCGWMRDKLKKQGNKTKADDRFSK